MNNNDESLRIGVDIGGTFTDFTVITGSGATVLWKEPTTPHDPTEAIAIGLDAVAERLGVSCEEMLGRTRLFVHGTTIATNMVIQRNGPRIGLLCTSGFRDVLYFRDGFKPDRFNLRFSPPAPFVERYLRLPVMERVGPDGRVLIELVEDDVRAAAATFRNEGVQAVAVAFLWSIVNDAHEHRAAEILAEELPGCHVVRSADVLPEIREWERTSAAVLSAYILPRIDEYFHRLKGQLGGAGLHGEPLIMQINGGCAPIEDILRRPVNALHSGPAAAPAAALYHAARLGSSNLITVDMGGTSFDVCLIRDGEAAHSRSLMVEDQPVGVAGVEVHSIGAGGGSIASVDAGGALKVGPRSAGSVPGPAAYGAGGTEPTVTDANVVLGYLSQDTFLGGRGALDEAAATAAVERHVAEPLGLDVMRAAAGIIRVVNTNMVSAIRAVSVERGIDPRGFALVCAGGAGGLHAARLAAELGMREVIIPREAGTFCAFGMTVTDVRHDYVTAFHALSEDVDLGRLDAVFSDLEAEALARLGEEGFARDEIQLQRKVDVRYPGQVHELTIPIATPTDRYRTEDIERVRQAFHTEHELQFAYRRAELGVEFLHWRVTATGSVPVPGRERTGERADAAKALIGHREVYLPEEDAMVEVPVYAVERIPVGAELDGPAVLAGETTTILMAPGDALAASEDDSFRLQVGARAIVAS